MTFDFSKDWTWNDLRAYIDNESLLTKIKKVEETISHQEAQFICTQLHLLEDPEDLQQLAEYQELQKEKGAWVEGLLPDQFLDEEIIIPKEFSGMVRSLWQLTQQKKKNIEAIKKLGAYPLKFKGEPYKKKRDMNYPDNWILEIDLSVLKRTIEFLKEEEATYEDALTIAQLPANKEMITHRTSLGYLPEPMVTLESLAALLLCAQRRSPVEMIWKWLNPMNFFDFADIFMHLDEYDTVLTQLETRTEEMKEEVLGTLYSYVRKDTDFEETFAFTIGFAIRGWATNAMCGVNIEYVKDDFEALHAVMAHELFHRLQTVICPRYGAEDTKSFEGLIAGPFDNVQDNKLYELLTYILLEGSGEFITRQFAERRGEEEVGKGVELLERAYKEIYIEKNIDAAEQILVEGLQSTGPFYSLGNHIIATVVKDHPSRLGEILQQGTPAFFTAYITSKETKTELSSELKKKIIALGQSLLK